MDIAEAVLFSLGLTFVFLGVVKVVITGVYINAGAKKALPVKGADNAVWSGVTMFGLGVLMVTFIVRSWL